jgi:hypothetical protein
LDRGCRLVLPLQLLSSAVPTKSSLDHHSAIHCSAIIRRERLLQLLRLQLRLLLLLPLLLRWLLLRLWVWWHTTVAVVVSKRYGRIQRILGASWFARCKRIWIVWCCGRWFTRRRLATVVNVTRRQYCCWITLVGVCLTSAW